MTFTLMTLKQRLLPDGSFYVKCVDLITTVSRNTQIALPLLFYCLTIHAAHVSSTICLHCLARQAICTAKPRTNLPKFGCSMVLFICIYFETIILKWAVMFITLSPPIPQFWKHLNIVSLHTGVHTYFALSCFYT